VGRVARLAALAGPRRARGGRWFAAEAPRDPKSVLRGRLEALGPVFDEDPVLYELEAEGSVLRTRVAGRTPGATGACSRASTATRSTGSAARSSPSAPAVPAFPRALAARGAGEPARGSARRRRRRRAALGLRAPAAAWEATVLPARVKGYRRDWLDQLTLSGRSRGEGSGARAPDARDPLDADLARPARAPRRLARAGGALGRVRDPGRARGRRPRGPLLARRDVPVRDRARRGARTRSRRGGALACWSRAGA
jgi:hypothetical protein